ncbi:MAG: carboxypeptidase regulatory-like domain-containing protein [Vicinamibacterales bacterium]
METRRSGAACAVLVSLWCMAGFVTPASAQSVITGTIKDTSGAVMPGVSVEAASPALIEGSRSAVTDESGQYRIVDLRPGVYALTFTLQGFNTVKRELELSSNFTATIDIALSVGALEESVTVTGSSPVVDVQSNVKQQVLARDVLDAVPTARTIQSIGQLVVGVTLTTPDVGGSRAMQQAYFNVRGTGASQTVVMVDGLMTNGMMADGGVQAYHNESMVQEAVYQTAGGSAETMTSGLNMNLVPKDGGNRFAGGAKLTKSPSSWQGDNLTQDLRDLGVGAVDSIANFYEWNVEQGGPILKDKVWFFAAFRKARYDKPIANTFVTPEGVAFNQGFIQCRDNPGSCEQGVSDEKMDNPVGRLTWQMSQSSKISAYMDRAMRFRGHAMGAGDDPLTASVVWNTPTFSTGSIKYTSTLSPSLLFEAGFSGNRERYDNLYQPGILAERLTPAWYQKVRKEDVSLGTEWNAPSAQLGNYPDRYYLMSAISYVTGAHNVKVGVYDSFGKYPRYNNANPTCTRGIRTARRSVSRFSTRRCAYRRISTPTWVSTPKTRGASTSSR